FFGNLNIERYGICSKKRMTSFGKGNLYYQRWYGIDCQRALKPKVDHPINFPLQIKDCRCYETAIIL
ncbi:MAG: hypothetical protein PHQ76_03965, partial [Caldisericia bacterium]|nr:hypothetical protein [Caldisericia bacterium]